MLDRRTRALRRVFRMAGWLLVRLLTRTRIEGRAYLDTPGPVIFAANHTSTFDALLLLLLLPPDAVFVGPGDFRLLWPAPWFVKHLGLILMKRGAVDRAGLTRMIELLKAGGVLGIFPEGGTWEKPISAVKPGASYVSYMTGAAIVPMGFGGTYQVWQRMLRLQFPRVTVRIAPPQPPVTVADRKQRQEALDAHARALMQTIYDLLPPETQAHYDRQARLRFEGALHNQDGAITLPDGTDLSALAELVAKPNLFSPLVHNARLPVRPFARHGRAYPAARMRKAAAALQDAFAAGDFADYLEYRLGEDKAASIRAALDAIITALDADGSPRARVAFHVSVSEDSREAGD